MARWAGCVAGVLVLGTWGFACEGDGGGNDTAGVDVPATDPGGDAAPGDPGTDPGGTDAATDPGGGDPGGADTPAVPGLEARRLYYVTTYPDQTLKSVRVDGTDLEVHGLMAQPPASVRYPRMSPDGRLLAYAKALSAGVGDGLHVWDVAANTDAKVIDHSPVWMDWSRDGTRILMNVFDHVVLLDPAGTILGDTGNVATEQNPKPGACALSPDGQQAAFAYDNLQYRNPRLYIGPATFSPAPAPHPMAGGALPWTLHWPQADRIVAVGQAGITVYDAAGTAGATHPWPFPADDLAGSDDDLDEQAMLPQPVAGGGYLLVVQGKSGYEVHACAADLTGCARKGDPLLLVGDDEFRLAPDGDAFYARDRNGPKVVALDGRTFASFPEDMLSMHVMGWGR